MSKAPGWKVLGKDALYIDIGPVWKAEIVNVLSQAEGGEKFKKLMDKSEVMHLFNCTTEIHNFIIEAPAKTKPADIQFMADMILGYAKENIDNYFVSLGDEYQKTQVIITNEEEPELIGKDRTEGYASGKIFMPIFESLSKPGRMNES